MTHNAETAIVYLQQGRQLSADVAKTVLPGAVMKRTVSDAFDTLHATLHATKDVRFLSGDLGLRRQCMDETG